ncbi:GNAT family N-acetyltransferase [Oceanirhabdus seepicola]|uniref:GNAT family N-acetyltransferase n=1 Tax=Oceanirhabdus seepicola TaxID=2828781 RepID=UPI003B845528
MYSFDEKGDSENGIELNYLFVNEQYRGKGISLKLLSKLLSEFESKDFKELVIYNYNVSPSNQYYRKLGGNSFLKGHYFHYIRP